MAFPITMDFDIGSEFDPPCPPEFICETTLTKIRAPTGYIF